MKKLIKTSRILSLAVIPLALAVMVVTLVQYRYYPMASYPFSEGNGVFVFNDWVLLVVLLVACVNTLLLGWLSILSFKRKTWDKRTLLLGLGAVLAATVMIVASIQTTATCGCGGA